jgi:hypothetical protein
MSLLLNVPIPISCLFKTHATHFAIVPQGSFTPEQFGRRWDRRQGYPVPRATNAQGLQLN